MFTENELQIIIDALQVKLDTLSPKLDTDFFPQFMEVSEQISEIKRVKNVTEMNLEILTSKKGA
jgi:actin-like ATPase involved in cell morphogenesis